MQQTQSSVSCHLNCWVPNCKKLINSKKELIPLPNNPKLREIWLALAGKAIKTPNENITFCSQHFTSVELKTSHSVTTNGLPLKQIPEKICRLCLSIIESNTAFYILSKFIPIEMPSCIKEMVNFYVPSNSEPLYTVVSNIFELDIEYNPPPLVCSSCFINAWLFYAFKMSALKVEKELRSDIPLEMYSKMILCRTCPVIFGTNFIVLEEASNNGKLLKKIFQQHSDDNFPLRVCTKCLEILSRIETFHQTCLIAEKKMRLQIQMERNIIERRNKSDGIRQKMKNQNCDVLALFNLSQENTSMGSKTKAPHCNSIGKSENELMYNSSEEPPKLFPEVSTGSHSRRKDHFWDKMREVEFLKLIEKEAQNYQIKEGNNEKLTWMKVFNLIRINNKEYNKYPEHSLKFRFRVIKECAMKEKVDSNPQTANLLERINQLVGVGKRKKKMCQAPKPTSLYPEKVKSQNLTKVQTQIAKNVGRPKDTFWNKKRFTYLLQLMLKEARYLQKQGETKQLTWLEILRIIRRKYPEFRSYSLTSLLLRTKSLRKTFKTHETEELIQKLEILLAAGNKKRKMTNKVNTDASKPKYVQSGKRISETNKVKNKPKTENADQSNIDKKVFVLALKRELHAILNTLVTYRSPIQEAIVRVKRKDFPQFSINLLKKLWLNLKFLAKYHHERNQTLREQDKIVLYIQKKGREYQQKKRGLLTKPKEIATSQKQPMKKTKPKWKKINKKSFIMESPEKRKKLKHDLIKILTPVGKKLFCNEKGRKSEFPWELVEKALKELNYDIPIPKVRAMWHGMVYRAKRVKTHNSTPDEFDKPIIELLKKHMTRTKKIKNSDSIECTEKTSVTTDSEREKDKKNDEERHKHTAFPKSINPMTSNINECKGFLPTASADHSENMLENTEEEITSSRNIENNIKEEEELENIVDLCSSEDDLDDLLAEVKVDESLLKIIRIQSGEDCLDL